MYRIACLRIPRFQIVAHQKQEPELKKHPFVLIARSSEAAGSGAPSQAINFSRTKVVSCSTEAAKSGIYAGMRLAEARAECAGLLWREYDAKLYQQTESHLLNELIACSPRVSAQQPGVFLLDAAGLQRLGGEGKLCRELLKLASRCGFVEGRVGIASSAFTALVATRCKTKRWLIIAPGQDQSFLEPLSIDHLPLTEERHALLKELGIRTMGQLAMLPAASLIERFKEEGRLIHELVRGIDHNQPRLPPLKRTFETALELGAAIESLNETVFFLKAMLERLSHELKNQMICADQLLVSFYNEDDKFDERQIQLIRPSNNAKFLVEVIKLTLESKRLMREFTALKITVISTSKENWEQPQIEMNSHCMRAARLQDLLQSDNAMLLLQRFRARAGDDAIVVASASDEYFFEKAGIWLPVMKNCAPPDIPTEYVLSRTGLRGLIGGFVMKRVLPPEQVLVRLGADARPVAVTHQGQWHMVIRITAPERLSGHWWESSIRKSYYTALLQTSQQANSLLVLLAHDATTDKWTLESLFD